MPSRIETKSRRTKVVIVKEVHTSVHVSHCSQLILYSAYTDVGKPHAYIRVESVPGSTTSQTLFKDLTYSRPNPWQPTPLIFSFSHASSFDVETTRRATEEWYALATGAERNLPMLFLGPPAFGVNKAPGTLPKDGNAAVWNYQEQVSGIARENHFEVLSLYNLTMQASSPDGERFGERVALVEAMMVINWLSKLDTS
jgi:hypothetical protein